MTTVTTVADILQMAIGMEQVGKDFYSALAQGSDDARVRQFCRRVARDEASHLETFRRMHDVQAETTSRRRGETQDPAALTALAKGHIQPDPVVVHKVAIGGNLKDALNMAVQMERDAIRFYEGLRALSQDSADVIREIVEEEQQHLNDLLRLAA